MLIWSPARKGDLASQYCSRVCNKIVQERYSKRSNVRLQKTSWALGKGARCKLREIHACQVPEQDDFELALCNVMHQLCLMS